MKRDLMVWMYDVSKQGFGAMFIHVWNIILSIHEVTGLCLWCLRGVAKSVVYAMISCSSGVVCRPCPLLVSVA